MKKLELKQIIKEELRKLKEEELAWEEAMEKGEYFDRMEGLANRRMLQTTQHYIRILAMDWLNEGFEMEDVKNYFASFIEQI